MPEILKNLNVGNSLKHILPIKVYFHLKGVQTEECA